MPIDITPYFNLIIDGILYVINFCRTRLVFNLAGFQFNMFTLAIGIWIFYRAMAAIFGDYEEDSD